MNADDITADLPDTIDALKTLIAEQSVEVEQKSAEIKRQSAEVKHYKHKLEALEEQIRLMRHKQFGSSSEKGNGAQSDLFNEAELEALGNKDEDSAIAEAADTQDKKTTAKKTPGGRKPLPAELPRIRIEHDISDTDKICDCGCQMDRIGEDVSEQLDIIPAKIQVIQNVRFKYACKCCEEGVKTTPLPPQPIPKSNASAGLLAYICTAKFMDALPLYRQEQIFSRLNIHLPRSTQARWMVHAGQLAQPLINLLHEHVNAYDIQHMDETRIQVLKEKDRPATSRSQMWVQKGGPPGQAAICYHYDPARSREVAARLLDNFSGYLQTDGYNVYSKLSATITQMGCWAHVRRKFKEAVNAQTNGKKTGKAHMGLNQIQKLYAIEKRLTDKPAEERQQLRQQLSQPIIDKLQSWLAKSIGEVAPSSKTGQALTYLNNQWPSLQHYLDDGRLNIDNNPAENAIRPFVVGRKNWMFADTPAGAEASANLYSLIETAKANDLEPYRYLRHIFKELPKAQSLSEIEALLPFNIDRAILDD